jgi:hypothetical protein
MMLISTAATATMTKTSVMTTPPSLASGTTPLKTRETALVTLDRA